MNQEIGFESAGHISQANRVEFSELSSASIKKMDLELIDLWNEKVNFWDMIYII